MVRHVNGVGSDQVIPRPFAEQNFAGFFFVYVENLHVDFHIGIEVAAEVATSSFPNSFGTDFSPGSRNRKCSYQTLVDPRHVCV